MTARPPFVAIVDDGEAVVDALRFLLQIEGYDVSAYHWETTFSVAALRSFPRAWSSTRTCPA